VGKARRANYLFRHAKSEKTASEGTYSLAVTSGLPGSEAEIGEEIVGLSSGALYFRAWFYIPEGVITDSLKLAAFNGATEAGVDVLARGDGTIEIGVPGAFHSLRSEYVAYPTEQWFCLQVDHHIDSVQGAVDVRVDKESVVSLRDVDTLPELSVSRIIYGIGISGSSQASATIYVDDVLASTEAVGCD